MFNKFYRRLTGRTLSKVFFMHLPKCGGTSTDKAIQNTLSNLNRSSLFHLSPQASLKASQVAENELMDYREKILLYYMADENCRYISGHFNYSNKAFQEFSNDWNFITLLRHPVSKWFSQYFYNRYKESSHFKIDTSLEKFLNSEAGINLGSDYVKKLIDMPTEKDIRSNNTIEEAINNLNKFSLVGTLEDLETFAMQYKILFGSKLFIKHRNSNPISKIIRKEIITDEIRKKVEEICLPDLKIYNAIVQKNKKQSLNGVSL